MTSDESNQFQVGIAIGEQLGRELAEELDAIGAELQAIVPVLGDPGAEPRARMALLERAIEAVDVTEMSGELVNDGPLPDEITRVFAGLRSYYEGIISDLRRRMALAVAPLN